jgi:hypothetical protein
MLYHNQVLLRLRMPASAQLNQAPKINAARQRAAWHLLVNMAICNIWMLFHTNPD